jgi:hypothetical protein
MSVTYGCAVCNARATAAGTHLALAFLGWFVEDEGEMFCPEHHPLGREQAEAQAAGCVVLLRLAQRASTDTKLAAEVNRLADGGDVRTPQPLRLV